jgi:hypothetical protein
MSDEDDADLAKFMAEGGSEEEKKVALSNAVVNPETSIGSKIVEIIAFDKDKTYIPKGR